MTRPSNWQSLMLLALAKWRETPFTWGHHDCSLFACNIAEVICGIDFAAPLRNGYKTKRGAYKVLKDYSGGGLEVSIEKMALAHSCEEVPVLLARRGDIVLAEIRVRGEVLEDAMGVCVGEGAAFAAEKGFVILPIIQARRAWRTP